MKKKALVSILTVVTMMPFLSFEKSYALKDEKTIVINMNKTNLDDMTNIPILKDRLKKEGYIGLMNTRGDGSSNDTKSYASIGAGAKANISPNKNEIFKETTNEESEQYKYTTGNNPLKINNIYINSVNNDNSKNGKYNAKLGSLGQSLAENNIKVSVLGNSDLSFKEEDFNRDFLFMSMDEYGRVPEGNIDNINIKDVKMPFGLKTDYNKLKNETKKSYDNNDILFVDLGDTYRLEAYKKYLNDNTFKEMKDEIFKNINDYLKYVFNLYNSNDNIYIISAYQKNIDYKNKKRLSPVIKFDGDEKGVLTSATTRRNGIISNVDLGVDILNNYNIKNPNMVGKPFKEIKYENNINYLNDEYKKIVTISSTRSNIINSFVIVVALSWVIAAILLVFRRKIPVNKEETIFKVLKEFIKLGMIIPLAFLIAPITNAKTSIGIGTSIIISVLMISLISRILFKNNDIKQMGFYSFVMISLIAIDSIFGTYLMQNNIMSYDALIGARYYGIGNEYEGVTIASAIFGLSVICYYKKPPKWLVSIFLVFVLLTSAHPLMGANVGGAISETIAYMVFIAYLFDVKINIKKIIMIFILAALVVFGFAITDMIMGTESHLSLFVSQIIEHGPITIIQTFARKIAMNVKLAQTSIWVNLLLVGIAIVAGLIFKPGKNFEKIKRKYPIIFKGFIASMVGCIVTLLVNDSGIVSASTASIYILIPLIIILINTTVFKKN